MTTGNYLADGDFDEYLRLNPREPKLDCDICFEDVETENELTHFHSTMLNQNVYGCEQCKEHDNELKNKSAI